jgi:hypothetical protein
MPQLTTPANHIESNVLSKYCTCTVKTVSQCLRTSSGLAGLQADILWEKPTLIVASWLADRRLPPRLLLNLVIQRLGFQQPQEQQGPLVSV